MPHALIKKYSFVYTSVNILGFIKIFFNGLFHFKAHARAHTHTHITRSLKRGHIKKIDHD